MNFNFVNRKNSKIWFFLTAIHDTGIPNVSRKNKSGKNAILSKLNTKIFYFIEV